MAKEDYRENECEVNVRVSATQDFVHKMTRSLVDAALEISGPVNEFLYDKDLDEEIKITLKYEVIK